MSPSRRFDPSFAGCGEEKLRCGELYGRCELHHRAARIMEQNAQALGCRCRLDVGCAKGWEDREPCDEKQVAQVVVGHFMASKPTTTPVGVLVPTFCPHSHLQQPTALVPAVMLVAGMNASEKGRKYWCCRSKPVTLLLKSAPKSPP